MTDNNLFYQAMIDAISQTLENMAFLEVIPHYDQEYEIPLEELVWTSLLINDPIQGELKLALTKGTLKDLTGAVFSLSEDEITDAQMTDILHELLNTIAGLFLTSLLPDNQTYKIGLPESGEGALPTAEDGTISWKLLTSEETALQVYATGETLVALNT